MVMAITIYVMITQRGSGGCDGGVGGSGDIVEDKST